MTRIKCVLHCLSAHHSESVISDSCHCHYSEVEKTRASLVRKERETKMRKAEKELWSSLP